VSREWSYTSAGTELRIMRLPDRNNLYLVLVDDDGMHCVARTLGDREAVALTGFLDSITSPQSEFAVRQDPGGGSVHVEREMKRRRGAEGSESP
jgi:hypothetical protein